MKICVFGAGAIGGYLAVELALAGNEVCVIARGAHLRAIQHDGLRLQIAGHEKTARVPASDQPADFGPQQIVICALKAHQAWLECERFAPLLGPQTAVVTAMNGIPWWYFHQSGGALQGHHLQSVDRGGRQWKAIGPARAIGCVVDPACEVVSPGVIAHREFKRFTLGEPDGSPSERVQALSDTLAQAGFDAPVRDNIRWNIWLKLWGNACFNPISLLTLATLDRITSEPGLRSVCVAVMHECRNVAAALQIEIPEAMIQRRLEVAGLAIGHKMSMLQDLEHARSIEVDALVCAVHELGQLIQVPTPVVDILLALAQERGRQAGIYA
ncbi:MAG TPA: 2-dehydropantoate 2-reductase [Steroidobacteraceae bacterium]|jgi:2-dehydropantoate 2-reductase|nr:2-dehydropantoate 2-reductase [Steroidobacteraceae bacterium]